MKRFAVFWILLLVSAIAAQQDSSQGELWSVVRINGARSGWQRDAWRTLQEAGRDVIRTETASEMRMKRAGTEMKIVEESAFEETPDGAALRFRYRSLASAMESVQSGEVRDGKLEITARSGQAEEKKVIPWKPEYLFPAASQRLIKQKGYDPGTTYDYKSYMPQFSRVITTSVKVIGREKVKLGKEDAELAKLEARIDAMPGVVTTMWVDPEGRALRTSVSMMGMTFVTEKCDRAAALLTEKGEVPEVLFKTLLRPERKLADPRKVAKAVYRITVKEGELRPATLAHDGQRVDKVEGQSVTVTVDPARPPDEPAKRPIDDPKLKEYLDETTVLQCRDPKVAALAKEAVGDETDAWKAAKKIERWVFENIKKKNFGVGFASAKEVAERLEGDCTEHAVLAAAMARAAGIPSRVAIGLVSVADIFGGHMWTEVWVGAWMPLDAAFAGEIFDATHIKMGGSAGRGTSLQEDLIGVLFWLGKMDLEILEVVEK